MLIFFALKGLCSASYGNKWDWHFFSEVLINFFSASSELEIEIPGLGEAWRVGSVFAWNKILSF